MTVEAKACTRCNEVKPLEEFYRAKIVKDGRAAMCKACKSIYQKERRARTPDKRDWKAEAAKHRERLANDPAYRERRRAHDRATYQRNIEHYREAHREYYRRDGGAYHRGAHRRRKYGISPADFDAMFAAQNGLCAVCGDAIDVHAHVDHCHGCHAIRGLLCSPCNTGIGQFQDDPERLTKAIMYLASHRD